MSNACSTCRAEEDALLAAAMPGKGGVYRDDQIKPWSHYNDPNTAGGNSHIHGDAPFDVRRDAVNRLIGAGDAAGLSDSEIAHVLAITDVESGFNPGAAAGTSSATGLGQFVDDTGAAYGLNASNRWDVAEQARALVDHFIDNRSLAARKGLGEAGIYALHHDGPSLAYGGMDLSKRAVQPKRAKYEELVAKKRECDGVCGDGPATTTIKGDAKWQTCWKWSCYLAKHVYKEPPPTAGFTTLYPDKMAEVEANWDEWDERDEQDQSGLVARLYKPKNYDPQDPNNICPPCLAFRGTDFDDFRGLAISVKIGVAYDIGFDFKGVYYDFIDKVVVPDTNATGLDTEEALEGAGYEPQTFFDDSGWVWIEGASLGLKLPLYVRISLKVWLADDGDWTNNFKQGLGEPSRQYESAKQYGRNVANTRILPALDQRLEVTGHSLGGGLASAVSAVIDHELPEIGVHCLTFNAAGVHPNTISPASLGDGNVHAFAVEDEILTTLGKHQNKIPLVGGIFQLGSRTMGTDRLPEPIGAFQMHDGISPGANIAHKRQVARGDPLPELFEIGGQNLMTPPPGSFATLNRIDAMLAGSSSVNDFANRLLRWANETYRERARNAADSLFDIPLTNRRVITVVGIYKAMFALIQADLQPELEVLIACGLASAEYHGMDFVIATYDHVNGTQ